MSVSIPLERFLLQEHAESAPMIVNKNGRADSTNEDRLHQQSNVFEAFSRTKNTHMLVLMRSSDIWEEIAVLLLYGLFCCAAAGPLVSFTEDDEKLFSL